MAWVAIPLMIAGTVMSAQSQKQAGKEQAQALNYQAEQMRVNAGQERAAAQRDAEEQRRGARLAGSRATALVAAGGGDTTDPTVVDILSGIDGEGEYRALTAMYQGEERARGLESGAAARSFEAKAAKRQANSQAIGTLFSGFSKAFMPSGTALAGGNSLMAKYG